MVNIVIYYPYLDGTSTSLIDMWFNLKRYDVDVDCYIVVDAKNIKQNIEYLKQVKNSTPSSFSYKTISLQELYERYWENLILSFGIFRFVDKLPLKYKHLFLLDAGRICFDVFANDRKLIKYVKSLNDVSLYGNKINESFVFPCDFYNIWYHKFSHERIDFLKQLNIEHRTVTMNDRLVTGNIPYKTLLSDELFYQRYDKGWVKDKILCIENIGKLIFEFSAINKKVVYSHLNKQRDDGLTEYLSLFGIDDNKTQEIHITENQLFDKLGMHENDLFLQDIRKFE